MKCFTSYQRLNKALSQEPCDDAISREDARMMLTCEIKDGMTITEYIKMVDRRLRKLPSVKPQESCDVVSRGVFEQVMWERDIAIEQLHELGYEWGQKIEPCDDAISRDMALKKMADYVASGYADSVEDFENYSRIICQLPSVTQKSGKWIIDQKEGYRIWHCHCSKCNKDPQDFIGGSENWWVIRLSDFCPNCGAKMESEDKE